MDLDSQQIEECERQLAPIVAMLRVKYTPAVVDKALAAVTLAYLARAESAGECTAEVAQSIRMALAPKLHGLDPATRERIEQIATEMLSAAERKGPQN